MTKKAKTRFGWGWANNKTRRLVAKQLSVAGLYGALEHRDVLVVRAKYIAEEYQEDDDSVVRVKFREV